MSTLNHPKIINRRILVYSVAGGVHVYSVAGGI